MPSWVMFPFIQCHHTRGLAPLGGFSNPLFSGSAAPCPQDEPAPMTSRTIAAESRLFHKQTISPLLSWPLAVVLIPSQDAGIGVCATQCTEPDTPLERERAEL